MNYEERIYRKLHRQKDLVHFQITIQETDLDIGLRKERYSKELRCWVAELILKYRTSLEKYIKRDPEFLSTLEPHIVLTDAPSVVKEMANAACIAGVGPMAAVAGAIAERIGKEIMKCSSDVIVENGGDIFLRTSETRYIGIYAGDSILSNRIAIEIGPEQSPLGICTSSGRIGHSLSFGNANAVVILSPHTAVADAVATAVGNTLKNVDDIPKAIEFARAIKQVTGGIIIIEEKLAAWGQVKIVPV